MFQKWLKTFDQKRIMYKRCHPVELPEFTMIMDTVDIICLVCLRGEDGDDLEHLP